MIVEVLRDICKFSNIHEYRYVGMGSIFYTDFRLLHKELGIRDMVCIEANIDDEERFKFNKPYNSIVLEMGLSTDVLAKLDWKDKNIVWLDYDEPLRNYMFEDIKILIPQLKEGSFFIMTCNSTFPSYYDKVSNTPKVQEFKMDFPNNAPYDMTAVDMTAKKSGRLLWKMFTKEIDSALININSVRLEEEKLLFKQLFHFTYKDGAPMFTLGGIMISHKNRNSFEKSSILKVDYIRESSEAFDIQAPIITNKEVDLLNKKLPEIIDNLMTDDELKFIPKEIRISYKSLYRYFPSYIEVRDF